MQVQTPQNLRETKRNSIIAAKRAATAREALQPGFEFPEASWQASIIQKLTVAGADAWCAEHDDKFMANLRRCGNEKFSMVCEICRTHKIGNFHCSQRWCTHCGWRLAHRRRVLIETMCKGMSGVKHMVLTQKNFTTPLVQKIAESRKALIGLRRSKFFGKVTGGAASLELTNEERGWHLHWHCLIQSAFLPADVLAREWGKRVGQEFAIVKVLDVSEKSYAHEVCKYIAKGSEIASWKPQEILEFVTALKKFRVFSCFGKFTQVRKFARVQNELEKPLAEPCQCGCNEYVFGRDEAHCNRVIDKYQASLR